MTANFDPDAIREQISNLKSERDRIDRAIRSLDAALQSIQGFQFGQEELALTDPETEGLTLVAAVKNACNDMVDGITRQRVVGAIEKKLPFTKPKPASVAASLTNLTKGSHPMLKIALEGSGRSPSFYSTQENTTHTLSADEIATLLAPENTKGSGGWQSLFNSLQGSLDKTKGIITLTPAQRARIYHYYRSYGGGGWQEKVRRIFRRELPHLFPHVNQQ